MNRWSLSNKIMPITHTQFLALTMEFMDACAHSWRGPVKPEITLYKAPQLYTTFMLEPEERAHIDDYNDSITLLKTDLFKDVTPINWDIAQHATVTLRPTQHDYTIEHAFSHIEFKGNFNRRATYYIQPGGSQIRDAILRNHPYMTRGDGYQSHGTQSGRALIDASTPSNANITSGILTRGKKFDF